MVDVTKFQFLAERLIRENGRDINIVVNPTTSEGGVLHDSGKPWRGTQRSVPVSSSSELDMPFYLTVKGIFLDFTKFTEAGRSIQSGDKNLFIAFLDAGAGEYIMTGKEKIVDNNKDWSIEDINIIQPNELFVYYDLQVRR